MLSKDARGKCVVRWGPQASSVIKQERTRILSRNLCASRYLQQFDDCFSSVTHIHDRNKEGRMCRVGQNHIYKYIYSIYCIFAEGVI
jgi:hypothetical protein